MRRAAAAAAHLDEERAEELTDAAPDAGAHPKVVAGTLTFGMFRFPNGAEQQGPFHEGKLHGSNCVYVWPSGNRFEGAMQHGRRVGIGKKTWKASGNSYAGEWANDQCAGFGVALDCNATIQRCGVWKGNVLAQSRPVPLSHLPADMFAKERDRCAILLRVRGEWYRGAVDAEHLPDGVGCWFCGNGRVKENGLFEHGALTQGFYAYDDDGSIYDGEWKDSKRHGEGKLTYKDGAFSEGTWSEDKLLSGTGVFLNGQTQRGTFRDGQLHGAVCIVEWPNGNRYEGNIEQSERVGIGKFTWRNGETFEGQWNKDRCGFGVQRRRDGKILACGLWANDALRESRPIPRTALPAGSLPHADDILLFPDGRTYRGALNSDHQPHGAGSMHRVDGSELARGNWTAGVLSGVGILRFVTSEMYSGQLVAGKRKGYGALLDADGQLTHCGKWNDNLVQSGFVQSCAVPRSALPEGSLSHPDDALLFPDGHTFRGEVNAQHQPHGRGSMHREDGSEESRGIWSAGVLSGLGLLRSPDGDVFEGQLKASKRNGFGALWDKEGKLLKCGEWGSGLFGTLDSRPVSGAFIPFGDRLHPLARAAREYLLYPSGELFIGPLIDGDQPHGEGTMYSAHGVDKQRGIWSEGRFLSASASPPVPAPVPPTVQVAPDPPAGARQAKDEQMDVDSGKVEVKPQPRRRSALCIGNNNYAPPLQPLTCCSSDAERMSCALQRLKFDSSVVRTDLDYSSLNDEINSFIASLVQQRYGRGDLALLYFSGHGCELGPNNVYLLPTDISCDDADQGGLSVQMLKRRFNRALNGAQVVFIFECCRVSETVNLSALYEQALEDRCEAETRAAKKEAAEKRTARRQQEAEGRKHRPLQSDDYSDSEPSQSLSSSSAALPAIRWQASTAPHPDDLTRNSFVVVLSCDTGHLAYTRAQGGSIFSTCLVEQMQSPSADLSVVRLLERSNQRMQAQLAALGQCQVAAADLSPTESITLAAERSL